MLIQFLWSVSLYLSLLLHTYHWHLAPLLVVYRSDDTHKKDGDALYLQGFYPPAGGFAAGKVLPSVAERQSSLCGQVSHGLCCCGSDGTAISLQVPLEDQFKPSR